MRPTRSPRIAAIGASSTGGRSTARPGSARRKPLTQATSGKQPQHLAERQHDADQQHADDQRVEAGIGEERGPDLAIEDDDEQGAEHEEDQHPDQKDPGRGNLERVDIVILLRHGCPPSTTVTSASYRPAELRPEIIALTHFRRQASPGHAVTLGANASNMAQARRTVAPDIADHAHVNMAQPAANRNPDACGRFSGARRPPAMSASRLTPCRLA